MLPSFSIVIPTYRRPRALEACLRSIAALDYPRDRFEVLVVDDGGDVPLAPVIASFASQLEISLIRQANAGPGGARNTGAARARGELLAFTDDDCRVEPGWLRGLARALAEDPDCLAGGRTLNVAPGVYAATSQLIVDVVYRHYNADPRNARFVASNNMALSARGFRVAGGFDPAFRFSEDRDFCDRWRHRGERIVYAPDARVRHAHAMGARGFCRQHFQYGRGAERFNRVRSLRGSGSMLAELGFHLDVRNWIGHPLAQVPLRQVPMVAVLLAVWQAANVAGFAWEKIRGRKDTLRDDALSFSR